MNIERIKVEQKAPFLNTSILIIGTGRSGISVCKLACSLHAKVTILDENEITADKRKEIESFGADIITEKLSKEILENTNYIILSPGIPVQRLTNIAPSVKDKIVSEIEFASRLTNIPIIAITGTAGKTTTTSLVAAVLENAGKKVFLGGNIGTPFAEYFFHEQEADIILLELSSFQLQSTQTLRAHVALLLNFAPNHLDHHESLDEYLQAKLSLFKNQTETDITIVPLELKDMLSKENLGQGKKIWYEINEKIPTTFLFGEHNQKNIAAAWECVVPFNVPRDIFLQTVASFKAISHRMEEVTTKNNIVFVNDSKSTTIDATLAAINSFNAPVYLLLGGKFKGGDVSQIIKAGKNKIEHIALFGAGREIFEPVLQKDFPVSWHINLKEAVHTLYKQATHGTILLSPATASFDAYKNYEDRGKDFRTIVENL